MTFALKKFVRKRKFLPKPGYKGWKTGHSFLLFYISNQSTPMPFNALSALFLLLLSLITKSVPPICTKCVPLGGSKLVNVVELS
jgi:hypothetical protein